MTIETAQMVVDGYSWKITQYNNQRVFNISQGEIAILDKVVLEELKVGTNWYCATCAMDRIIQIVALAQNHLNTQNKLT